MSSLQSMQELEFWRTNCKKAESNQTELQQHVLNLRQELAKEVRNRSRQCVDRR